jgi:hypothetical protein
VIFTLALPALIPFEVQAGSRRLINIFSLPLPSTTILAKILNQIFNLDLLFKKNKRLPSVKNKFVASYFIVKISLTYKIDFL